MHPCILPPFTHHFRPHFFRDPIDLGHLEHAGGDQNDFSSTDQIAGAEAEIHGASGDPRGAFATLVGQDVLAFEKAWHEYLVKVQFDWVVK